MLLLEYAASISSVTGPMSGNVIPHRSLRLSSSSSSLSSTHSHDNEREFVTDPENRQQVLMRQKSDGSYTESRLHKRSSRRASGGRERVNELGEEVFSSSGRSELNLEGDGHGGIDRGGNNRGGNSKRVGGNNEDVIGGSFKERGSEKELTEKGDKKIKKSPRRQSSKEKAELKTSSQSFQTPIQTPNTSTMSTPEAVPLPPNPPPTPATGVGGVPIPPPPPPAFSAETHSNLKRVNWEKINGAEGTIWKEVNFHLLCAAVIFVL